MAKLATLAACNALLDSNKLVLDDTGSLEYQRAAERIIKGRLFGIVDAEVMSTWDTSASPGTVSPPELIQEIAAHIVASLSYAAKYSEDDTQNTPYAQMLYNRAMSLLEGVATGTFKLYDLDPSVVPFQEGDLQEGDFWPNDNTGVQDPGSDKKFRMNMRF